MRSLALIALLATAAAAPAAAAPRQRAAGRATVRVAMTDTGFRFGRASVRRGTTVVFVLRNAGTKPHNMDVVGLGRSAIIQPGRTTRLVIAFRKRGRYQVVSDVPGQLQHGVVGTFRVV